LGGQNEELESSLGSMKLALALAVFLVYLVMACQFESLLHPIIMLITVPLAAIGVVLALLLTSTPISVVVFLGAMMLAGIVVNNGIVLVDCINQFRARGMEKTDAVREACNVRLRPIVMTTVTTALGLLPMALGLGEGAEIRTPMAITVIGGLLVSAALTLFVVPSLYLVLDRKR
jgi:HAE1 family hydrophobic/amphiphilic exporter-1